MLQKVKEKVLKYIFTIIMCICVCLCSTHSIAKNRSNSDEYISGTFNQESANSYKQAKELSTRYLAQRDLSPWLAKIQGKHALDYGSGLGFSVEYLLKQGFKVDAVDINPEMIAMGKKSYPDVNFKLATEGKLPYTDRRFDLVFSSWVLFEMDTLEKITNYLKESKRVMKDDGYFIAIIASKNIYDPKFKSNLYDTNFKENENLQSGSLVKMKYLEINMAFVDYFWSEADYCKAFDDAGLKVAAIHYPVGKTTDPYPWLDELHKSPVLLILATKA